MEEQWESAARLFRNAVDTVKLYENDMLSTRALEAHADSLLRIHYHLDELKLNDHCQTLNQIENRGRGGGIDIIAGSGEGRY